MKTIPIESKDISVLTALKPFLSQKGQDLVDIVVTVFRVFNVEGNAGLDTEALAKLVEILQRDKAKANGL
jgi:hypothetical protein